MKKTLTITDLTRMHAGRVCFAGYDDENRCIRPVLHGGFIEMGLYRAGKPEIFPFAQVEFDLLKPEPQPPHTEDWLFSPYATRYAGTVADREAVLRATLFDNVAAIFEQPVHSDFGFYVMDCQGPRSLGTVRPAAIAGVQYGEVEGGVWSYRLLFIDRQDVLYRLKIVDITWNYFCNSLRGEDVQPKEIAAEMTGLLKHSKVYLRIGLSRGWEKFPERCFLQITGIYTFPDYAAGKTFADFAAAAQGAYC